MQCPSKINVPMIVSKTMICFLGWLVWIDSVNGQAINEKTRAPGVEAKQGFHVLENQPGLLDEKSFNEIPEDLVIPPLVKGKPKPGHRTIGRLQAFRETNVFHTVYLPIDWEPQKKYPVICEYAGNGPYQNKLGDTCSGKVEDGCLGYGIGGGEKFIWIGLPFISKDKQQNQLRWWGDVPGSVDYCQQAVRMVCSKYGGDPDRILLCGFSRGSIACNYIGLHDDEIASLWCGMICHSHYDGVRRWNYTGDDRASAIRRLKRLNSIPQFISHERSIDETREYLAGTKVQGDFTLLKLPFPNHTDRWVLKDIPQRNQLRDWVRQVVVRGKSRTK